MNKLIALYAGLCGAMILAGITGHVEMFYMSKLIGG